MRRPRLVQHQTGPAARRNKMEEKKYEVLNGIKVLASNMEFEMALVFIEGYRNKFYNERLELTIREMDRNIEKLNTGYQE